MSTTRVLVPGVLLLPGARIELDEQRAHHVRDVLRHAVGDTLVVFDGAGVEADARVVEIASDWVEVQVIAQREAGASAAAACRVELAVALLKGDKLDWVFEKATELGAAAFHPLQCEHSVVQLAGERAASRLTRWQRLVEGAARQCERADVPAITVVRGTADGLRGAGEGAVLRLVCMERSGAERSEGEEGAAGAGRDADTDAGAILARARATGGRVVVAIGPEGGWSASEKETARRLGYAALDLGPRILRAETAAVAALAIIQRALGNLG